VVQISDKMIRERVKFQDFERIAKENEYFLWHFLIEEQHDSLLALWSIFEKREPHHLGYQTFNQLDVLLSEVNVPYFESYVKDSMDFLINLGLSAKSLYRHSNKGYRAPRSWSYQPVVIAFKRTRMINNTLKTCYCVEGITKIILEMKPELLSHLQ
jgi:hypothetical protein